MSACARCGLLVSTRSRHCIQRGASTCRHMLTQYCFVIHWHMPAYASMCSHMVFYAGVRWHLLAYVSICQHMRACVSICHASIFQHILAMCISNSMGACYGDAGICRTMIVCTSLCRYICIYVFSFVHIWRLPPRQPILLARQLVIWSLLACCMATGWDLVDSMTNVDTSIDLKWSYTD